MENVPRVGAGFGVMLIKKGELLLGRRNDDPEKASSMLDGAGTWTMPGGKLKFGESFEDGARREVMEETGIRLNSVRVIAVNNDIASSAHFVTVGMLAEDFEGDARVTEPEEITEWGWFPLNSLPSPLYAPSRKLLGNYLSKSFYMVHRDLKFTER